MIQVRVPKVRILVNLCLPPSPHPEKSFKSPPQKRISKLTQKTMMSLLMEPLKILRKSRKLQQPKRRHLLSHKRSPRKGVRTENRRRLQKLLLPKAKQSLLRMIPKLVLKQNQTRGRMMAK